MEHWYTNEYAPRRRLRLSGPAERGASSLAFRAVSSNPKEAGTSWRRGTVLLLLWLLTMQGIISGFFFIPVMPVAKAQVLVRLQDALRNFNAVRKVVDAC